MSGAIVCEEIRQPGRQHRRENRGRVGEAFVDAIGGGVPADLGVGPHEAEYNGVDVRVRVERDHEEAERQRGRLDVAPRAAVECRQHARDDLSQQELHPAEHQQTRSDERRRQADQAVPGPERGAAGDEEEHAIGDDRERLEIEALKPLQQAARRQEVRTNGGGDPQRVAQPDDDRVGPQRRREHREEREPDSHPHELDAEHLRKQPIRRRAVARDGPHGDLAEAQVHDGFHDGRQRQRVREAAVVVGRKEPPGDRQQDQQQSGAAGRERGVAAVDEEREPGASGPIASRRPGGGGGTSRSRSANRANTFCSSYWSTTDARARAVARCLNASSATSARMAAASAAGRCGWHSLPLSPSITKSSSPPTPEATTGTPEARASTADKPCASKCEGWMTMSAVRRSGATSAIDPRNRTDAPRSWRADEIPRRGPLVPGMVRHVRPGHQEYGVRRPQLVPRLHQIHHAFFAAEASDEQAHDGAGRNASLASKRLAFVAHRRAGTARCRRRWAESAHARPARRRRLPRARGRARCRRTHRRAGTRRSRAARAAQGRGDCPASGPGAPRAVPSWRAPRSRPRPRRDSPRSRRRRRRPGGARASAKADGSSRHLPEAERSPYGPMRSIGTPSMSSRSASAGVMRFVTMRTSNRLPWRNRASRSALLSTPPTMGRK